MYTAIIKFLAPYLMQIAAGLIVLSIITGGYFYIKHIGVIQEREADNKRIAQENIESEAKLQEAIAENAAIKQQHTDTFIGVLTNATNITNTLASQRDAALARLRQSSTSKSSDGTKGGKGDVPGRKPSEDGGAGEQIQESYEIAELAQLCLVASKYIRDTDDVR